MPFRTVDTNSRNSVFNYLEDVLDYYKTAENATLSEWPAIEKGYEPFQKNESFYRHAMSWFINRNINVIKHNKKNRYLSTFILAAEFPPTLGYGRLIEELVKQCGWLSLYRSPKDNLIDFIESIDINAYSVVQRQSLNIDSEGYYALLNLIEILSSIRYSLDSPENLDSVCAVVSERRTTGILIWYFELPIHTKTFSFPLTNRLSKNRPHCFHINLLMMESTGIFSSSTISQKKYQYHYQVQFSCPDSPQESSRFYQKTRMQSLRKPHNWLR